MTPAELKKGIGWQAAFILGFISRMGYTPDDLNQQQLDGLERTIVTEKCNCYPCRIIRWTMINPKNAARKQRFCDYV